MSLSGAMRLSASGLAVERFRMDVTSGNLANADVVAKKGQAPFARQLVDVEGGPDGPRIVGTRDAPGGTRSEHQPDNPNADAEGMVTVTNVNPVTEMLDMMGATRAYEANVKAFNAAKGMAKSALEIGKA